MSTPSHSLIFLFLCLPAVLVRANVYRHIYPCPCKSSHENETRLRMYLHQFPAWPSVPNRNEYGVINSSEPIGFGQMYVHDWFITTGPGANENVVGRLQGYHLQASQTSTTWYTAHTMVFRDGSFAGSTLEVSGILDKHDGRWSITGGTAAFGSAHGTIKFTESQSSTEIIRELDIHVFHTPETVV
ncbi:pterocarpan synthase 1-like isoform X2 [Oryza brachyantha]|uniref:Dirigent protein n=2 Tax=Oryza brachyantha TaxID=4533 RepID=J3MSG2_ORYBR|nr:pterocarpan synthase 1-like isoform X2 [Oryza brachyantha]